MTQLLSINGKPIHVLGDDNWSEYVSRDGDRDGFGLLPPAHDDMMCSLRVTTWEASGLKVYDEKELGERLEDMWAAEASIMHNAYRRDCLDQTRGTCFPAGTLIRMGDGSYKPIEKINVLDKVLTAEGRVKSVTQVMVRHHSGELCRPWVVGHQHLRATPEHPILTKRGYVEVQHLQKGDLVAFPKYAANSTKCIQPAAYLPPRHALPQKAGVTTRYGNGGDAYRYCVVDIPDIIELTEQFGRLIGLFLAEGSVDTTRLVWTFNIDESETLAEETCELIRACCGAEPVKRETAKQNVVRVFLFGRRWRELFTQLCSHGASRKRLHPDLLEGPVEFLRGILYGWHAGDKKTECSAATVSHEMAMNMFDIANLLGKRPRFEYIPEKTDKNGVHHRKGYVVWWEERTVEQASESLVSKRWKTDDEPRCMWRRIEKVDRIPFDGWVFNLEVEDDHSYVAEGIGVHNCWIHGTCQACMQLLDMQGGTQYRELSPASVAYHCYNNFGVNGGYPAKGVAEFQQHGACDLSYWPENGFSSKYDTDESQANRVHNWLEEVVILDGGGEERLIKLLSAHVQGKPGGASFNWWNHYVDSCWGRRNDGENQLGIRNSWGNNGYGDKGFGLLSGSRKYPSWACVFLRMRQSPRGPEGANR